MKLLVFDLKADFAYFKVPEGTRSNYSFPFPPRTALIGMIAAITGKVRNGYWRLTSFKNLKVGIEIIKDPITYGIKMNYWRSKTVASIGGRKLGMKLILGGSDTKDRGFTTQVKLDYLTDVYYRIYLSVEDNELYSELIDRLAKNKYYYPPYLGHANLLAEINFIGEMESKPINKGEFITIIPDKAIENQSDFNISSLGGFKQYNSIPNSYTTEENDIEGFNSYVSIPNEYVNSFVPELGKTLPFTLKDGYGFRVANDMIEVDLCLF